MARTRKAIQPLNLAKYDVLVEDRGVRSDYFKISQFDGYFYGGRNAFLVAGAGVLRPGSNILVEILNSNGTTIYSAPVRSFIEGNSRLIQVEVYEDTPIGPGKIIILGSTDFYTNGTPIPGEWVGKYNVRWMADVIISPLIENKTPIRFTSAPQIVVEEKFYVAPSSASFTESISIPVDVQFNSKYYNVFPNGYLLSLAGPQNTRFFSKYLNGGIVTGSIKISGSGIIETASIDVPLTRIFNKDRAESVGRLAYTDKNKLIYSGFFSSSGEYNTAINPFGNVAVTSSLELRYNELNTGTTGSNVSFAKIRLVNLSTISGEIKKVRLSYKPATEPGEYVLLGDVETFVAELLSIDSGSFPYQTGYFNDGIVLNDYWYSATMSVAYDDSSPVPPQYYLTSSIVTTNNFLTQCCTELLDSVNATPEISISTFKDDVSYFIGTKESNTILLFPNSEYTLSFEALTAKTSASIVLEQPNYSLEVYLIPTSGSQQKIIDTSALGQLIGKLTPNTNFQKQNFESVEFNFKPKITTSGKFGLRFVVYGGFWNIANVSIKAAQEPFFSSDELDVLIPQVNYADKILEFKTEYLDINNNSIGVSTTSLPTYFTGSDFFYDPFPYVGDAVISGSLIVSGSGYNVSITGSGLTVSASTSISGSTTIVGPSTITGSLAVTGSSIVTGSLDVSGSTNLFGFTSLQGIFEKATIVPTAPPSTVTFDVIDQVVLYHTSNTINNWVLNVRGNSSTTINSILAIGQSLTVVHIVVNGGTPHYNTTVQIDGVTQSVRWQGGAPPGGGNANAADIYSYAIVKTGNAQYSVFAAQVIFG
jgi:hypothetical protein